VGTRRERIQTDRAPQALGPYSQAIRSGDFVFCAGQVAIDPATGALVAGDAAEQTRQVMRNLSAVLEAADLSLAHIVKTTIFLVSMDDFAAVNAVYAESFAADPPARATIAVAALPLGARVEIEAIARG
jgi:2-iminobutanoate/2-iminopropanoate deaminase